MNVKSGVILFVIFVGIISLACSNVNDQIESRSMSNLEQQTEPSDVAIREMFIESGLADGDSLLEDLMKIDRERVVAIVRELKDNGIREGDTTFGAPNADKVLRLKAAYFLFWLGVEADENEKYVVDVATANDAFLRNEALGWVAAMVGDGRKQHLPLLFAATAKADTHLAEGLTYFYLDELQASPDSFLRQLSKQSTTIRFAVYRFISKSITAEESEEFEAIRKKVAVFLENPELKAPAAEFLKNCNTPKASP